MSPHGFSKGTVQLFALGTVTIKTVCVFNHCRTTVDYSVSFAQFSEVLCSELASGAELCKNVPSET